VKFVTAENRRHRKLQRSLSVFYPLRYQAIRCNPRACMVTWCHCQQQSVGAGTGVWAVCSVLIKHQSCTPRLLAFTPFIQHTAIATMLWFDHNRTQITMLHAYANIKYIYTQLGTFAYATQSILNWEVNTTCHDVVYA
jgi:hypothetical protein